MMNEKITIRCRINTEGCFVVGKLWMSNKAVTGDPTVNGAKSAMEAHLVMGGLC